VGKSVDAAPVLTAALKATTRENRKDLMAGAVALLKSGAEPSSDIKVGRGTRAQRRQAARAMGWRGKKAGRQNFERNIAKVRNAVMVDESLHLAQDRIEHPVRSRLRRS
jgi:hypothetical protein